MKTLIATGALALWSLAGIAYASSIAGNCNPVAVKTCGLPFPSDLFMDSATHHLAFDDAVIDTTIDGPVRQQQPMLGQMDPAFTPAKIFNGSTGFSAVGPVLFELPAAAASALPQDGGELVKVFDIDSGQRVGIFTRFSRPARQPQDPARASHVIEIWPRSRLEFGHRYVAVLTTGLRMKTTGSTADFARSHGMDIALGLQDASSAAEIALFNAYQESLDVLQTNAITPQQILSATFFTVRQEQEVTAPLLKMADEIATRDLHITGLKPGKPLGSPLYGLATLYGRIDLVNFRDATGGVNAPYEPIAFAAQENVEVLITAPKVDPASDIPVALWGHGVGNRKEVTTLGFVRNDALGIATVAIDHPNHGSRINNRDRRQRDYTQAGANPKDVMIMLGAQIQAAIDQVAVMAAVRNSIGAAFDEARPTLPALAHGDGSRIAYHARSYGSMIGVSAVAASHDVLGAHYLSGCGSLVNIMSSSLFWPSSSQSFPRVASGAEVTFQMAMMQHYLDIADGLNFAHYYRHPPAGREPKKVAMQYALNDGSTLNEICEAQAIVMELPLLRNVLKPVPLLPHGSDGIDGFEDGYGIYQLPYIIPNVDARLQKAAQFDARMAQLAQSQGQQPPPPFAPVLKSLLFNDYNGFKTHWNVVTPDSTKKSIDWNCEVMSIAPELCERARQAPLAEQ
jgi:hypothetical protein